MAQYYEKDQYVPIRIIPNYLYNRAASLGCYSFSIGHLENEKIHIKITLKIGINIISDHQPEYPAFLAIGLNVGIAIKMDSNIIRSCQTLIPNIFNFPQLNMYST